MRRGRLSGRDLQHCFDCWRERESERTTAGLFAHGPVLDRFPTFRVGERELIIAWPKQQQLGFEAARVGPEMKHARGEARWRRLGDERRKIPRERSPAHRVDRKIE